jgi:hypothetical protein
MYKKLILIIIIVLLIVGLSIAGFLIYENYTKEKPCSTCSIKKEKVHLEKRILMFGRSVMAGWFDHWHDDTTPMQKEGYTLEYHELSSPPEIVESFKNEINKLSSGNKPIVFFKFCFVDFTGGSKQEAEENLEQNKKYIEEVYRITKYKGLKLIIGNALSQVAASTDPDLKWNHKQFNQWLLDFQSEHEEDITIFDMYNVFIDSSGNLKAEFASDPYDSHLNDAAYNSLDKAFFNLLKNRF